MWTALPFWVAVGVALLFGVILVYDFWYQRIPFLLTIFPAAVLFFGQGFFDLLGWKTMILGSILSGGFLGIQFFISKGDWIGGGDIGLGILIGVTLGAFGSLMTLVLTYIFGAFLAGILLSLRRVRWDTKIPLGSLLSFFALLILFFGENVFYEYIQLW